MVVVVDDMILLPLSFVGIEPTPNIIIMSFNAVHKHALEEMYPTEGIQDKIKENRMKYELGELSRKEYKKRELELAERLKIARRVREMRTGAGSHILNL